MNKALLLGLVLLFASSCAMTSESYCRKMLRESSIPIGLDACQKCYDRYGQMAKELLIGCALGVDMAGAFAE